ncbi:MAG: hypothetical protein RI988_299 [Pseudomonadota bacterium]
MRVTATEARNRFGSLCAQAKHGKASRAAPRRAAPRARRSSSRNSVSGFPRRTPASTRKAFLAPSCAPGERQMAQYDICANPSSSAATGIPYGVVIQSDLLDALSTRLTVPWAVQKGGAHACVGLCDRRRAVGVLVPAHRVPEAAWRRRDR